MIVLGLDPGTQRAGWGVIDVDSGRRMRYVGHGVIIATGRTVEERIRKMLPMFSLVLAEYRPEVAAVERPFVGKFPKAAIALGFSVGAFLSCIWGIGIDAHLYEPKLVKMAVHSGRATKSDVGIMVRAMFGLKETPPTDAADALAVAVCHGGRMSIEMPA